MTAKAQNLGIGILAEAELLKGASDEEALIVVINYFRDAKTNINCIKWYRSKLRKRGYDVPTSAEARQKPNFRLVA